MATSVNDKSIPLPKFNGKEETYMMWRAKMKGFMSAKGLWDCIVNSSKLPKTEAASVTLDPTKSDDAAKIKLTQSNALAMAFLLNAFVKDGDTQR